MYFGIFFEDFKKRETDTDREPIYLSREGLGTVCNQEVLNSIFTIETFRPLFIPYSLNPFLILCAVFVHWKRRKGELGPGPLSTVKEMGPMQGPFDDVVPTKSRTLQRVEMIKQSLWAHVEGSMQCNSLFPVAVEIRVVKRNKRLR